MHFSKTNEFKAMQNVTQQSNHKFDIAIQKKNKNKKILRMHHSKDSLVMLLFLKGRKPLMKTI